MSAASPGWAFPAGWTAEEVKAVQSLERLAARWPKSLMLFSAAGTLVALQVADNDGDRLDSDRCHTIDGIRNDGGDPW